MPTFYRIALDTLVTDLARSLRPVPVVHGLNRPAITVIQGRAGYDRDVLIRDAIDGAAARHHLPVDGLVVPSAATVEDVQRAVDAMLGASPSPRILVVHNLLVLPPDLRRTVMAILRNLEDAVAPCHVITTLDEAIDLAFEWGGRTQRVEVDLTPRPELAAVLMARGACLPGRSPLVRRLFVQQWKNAPLQDRAADPLYAEALGEFTADALAVEPWPWVPHDDDPVVRMAVAALGLEPSLVEPVLRALMQRLANHPAMVDRTVASVWDEPSLNEDVRTALLASLGRPVSGWNPGRQLRAARVVLQRPELERVSPPSLESVDWTVVDGPMTFHDTPEPLTGSGEALAADPPIASGWRGWWPRWCRWWTQRTTPVPPQPSGPGPMSRGEDLVWSALQALTTPDAPQRWVRVSIEVVRTTLRWPEDERQDVLRLLFDGLGSLPGLWEYDATVQPGTRWSMTARHALLIACEALPGWTPAHQQSVRAALDPDPLPLYTALAPRTTPASMESPPLLKSVQG